MVWGRIIGKDLTDQILRDVRDLYWRDVISEFENLFDPMMEHLSWNSYYYDLFPATKTITENGNKRIIIAEAALWFSREAAYSRSSSSSFLI